MRRAHEIDTGPTGLEISAWALLQLIVHHLGNGQLGQGLVQRFLQALAQGGTDLDAVKKQRLGFAIGQLFQAGHGFRARTQGSEPFEQSRCGLPFGIQAHADRHQLLLNGLVSRLGQHARHVHGQAARRGIGRGHGISGRQALRFEGIGQHQGEGFAQFLQSLRRQFFNEQFDEQVGSAHGAQAAFLLSWARTSSAQARGAMGKPSRARLSR